MLRLTFIWIRRKIPLEAFCIVAYFEWIGLVCQVLGSLFYVLDFLYLVLGSFHYVLGSLHLILCSFHNVLGPLFVPLHSLLLIILLCTSLLLVLGFSPISWASWKWSCCSALDFPLFQPVSPQIAPLSFWFSFWILIFPSLNHCFSLFL